MKYLNTQPSSHVICNTGLKKNQAIIRCEVQIEGQETQERATGPSDKASSLSPHFA